MNEIICGDCLSVLSELPGDSVDCVITSPPYFRQREYGGGGIGCEPGVDEYIANLVNVFRHCARIVKKTGTVVFNLGDKYAEGGLLSIPWRFALEVQKEGLARLVNQITWVKANPVPKPSSKKLIPATEPFFIFAKSGEYNFFKDDFMKNSGRMSQKAGCDIGKSYFALIEKSGLDDSEKIQAKKELESAIAEARRGDIESFRMKIRGCHALPYGGLAGGRMSQIKSKGFSIIKMRGNPMKRDVIESKVESIRGCKHPAVYPEYVVGELIKLLTKPGDIVMDPFMGSGTTAVAAAKLGRKWLGIEISPKYIEMARKRISDFKNRFMSKEPELI